MTKNTTTPRNFRAHVELTAENANPAMVPGLYESIGDFYALIGLYADLDEKFEKFEPVPSNEWVSAGLAGTVAYRSMSATGDYPYTLAVYVEGDVTRYNFPRFEDAARAGRLWAAGLI
ncbi:hypothetical protein [Microbacterium sp.]|uniref:hypothetical protein n=1 Tax=Microbacterium sp. TaxID=51671 RepID=UPI003F9655D6